MSHGQQWNVLVIDDEEDVHKSTALSLKYKKFKNRGFNLIHAYSAKEARQVLTESKNITVAIVDVVMEETHSGLDLCSFIRENCDYSLRIILRTGQPGVSPEEKVFEKYDIDYYLSKQEASGTLLYTVLRSCIRAYNDINTISIFSDQLKSIVDSLNKLHELEDVLLIFSKGLDFIGEKNECKILFVPDWSNPSLVIGELGDTQIKVGDYKDQILQGLPANLDKLIEVNDFYILSYSINITEYNLLINGTLFILTHIKKDSLSQMEKDLDMLMENWKSAFYTIILQKKIKEEKSLREREHLEKIESIASMVSGISHEVNTPLGVIKTTASILGQMVENLVSDEFQDDKNMLIADIKDSCELIDKNVVRAANLIQSFKKVSASQLHDQSTDMNLLDVINDSLLTISPNVKKNHVTINVHPTGDTSDFACHSYPGYWSQVLFNLIENSMKYGYPDGVGGVIDIYLEKKEDKYHVTYIDHGKGIDEENLHKIFDPFFTTGRNIGGTGLGLAIVQNIIVNILGGTIECYSKKQMGVKFTIITPPSIAKKEEPEPHPEEGSQD